MNRLGNTAYKLADMTAEIDGDPFIPASLLNRLRQEAVEMLVNQQAQAPDAETQNPARPLVCFDETPSS